MEESYRTPFVILLFGFMVIQVCCSTEEVRFVYQPSDHSATEGKRAHFTCIFQDIPDNMEGKYGVIWTKDSYVISEPSNGFDLERFSFHNEYANRRHDLKIDPVTREDAAGYRCHLSFNDDIVLTSNTGKLTVREIPSKLYPSVDFERLTYKIGEEIIVKCVCEKTNPKPRLEWPSPGAKLLRPRPGTGNETHIWIEATMPATISVNGTCLGCKLKVKDEVAPRYSRCTERLRIRSEDHDLKTEPAIPNTDDQPVTLSFIRASRMPLKGEDMAIPLEFGIPNEGKSRLMSLNVIGIIGGLVCFSQLSL